VLEEEMNFTDNIITAILSTILREIISMTIKKYIFEKKWEIKFPFLKKKQSSNTYDSSIVHPNTPLTWTGNGFRDHY
jgi:hypothetical protein